MAGVAGKIDDAIKLLRKRSGNEVRDTTTKAARGAVAGPKPVQPVVRNVQVGEFSSGLDRINKPGDAAHIIAQIRKSPQEEFLAIVTDGDGKVLDVLRHTRGISDAASVETGPLIGSILDVPDAKTVWVAHNHPAGIPGQSSSDKAIAARLADSFDGTGVSFEGQIVVAPGKRTATWFADDVEREVAITAAPRRGSVPISQRQFRAVPQDLPVIGSDDAAKRYQQELGNGVLFLNSRNGPVGFLELSNDQMMSLREGSSRDVFLQAHRNNANRAIVFGDTVPAQNTATMLRQIQIEPLDILKVDGTSLAAQGESLGFNSSWYTTAGTAVAAGLGAGAALTPEDAEAGVITRTATEAAQRISQRFPTAARATEDPLTEDLVVDLESTIASGEKAFAKNAQLVGDMTRTGAKTPRGQVSAFMDQAVDNLMWLHGMVPPETRVATRQWYNGANRIARELSEKYGVTLEQASGVLASLSPQKDWYQNVSLAERVLDVAQFANQGNYIRPDRVHLAKLDQLYRDPRFAQDIEAIRRRPWSQLSTEQKSMFVRSFDEANSDRGYDIIDPTGERAGRATTKDGKPRVAAWGSNPEIGKAISVLEDGSIENISRSMGQQHKVRNFYNNIADPEHARDIPEIGDITVDTHAVAALLLKPLGGSSPEVTVNFGGTGSATSAFTGVQGTYGINADAYRQAAKELGIMPRELQSINWEAARNLFPAKFKQNKRAVEDVQALWDLHRRGKLSRQQAQELTLERAGGMDESDWVVRPDSGVVVPPGAAADEAGVLQPDVRQRGSGGVDARAGLVAAGMPAAWLGLGGTGALGSADVEAAVPFRSRDALSISRPEPSAPADDFDSRRQAKKPFWQRYRESVLQNASDMGELAVAPGEVFADFVSSMLAPIATGPTRLADVAAGRKAPEIRRLNEGRSAMLNFEPRTELGQRLSTAAEEAAIGAFAPLVVAGEKVLEPALPIAKDVWDKLSPEQKIAVEAVLDISPF